jgi:YD repeat-containing protein
MSWKRFLTWLRRLIHRLVKRPRPRQPLFSRLKPELDALEDRAFPGQMWDVLLGSAVTGSGWAFLDRSVRDALAPPLPPLPQDQGWGGWGAWLVQNSAQVQPPADLPRSAAGLGNAWQPAAGAPPSQAGTAPFSPAGLTGADLEALERRQGGLNDPLQPVLPQTPTVDVGGGGGGKGDGGGGGGGGGGASPTGQPWNGSDGGPGGANAPPPLPQPPNPLKPPASTASHAAAAPAAPATPTAAASPAATNPAVSAAPAAPTPAVTTAAAAQAPTTPTTPTGSQATGQPAVQPNFGAVPLAFEPNVGQTDSSVQFLAHGPGYMAFLTPTHTVLTLAPPAGAPGSAANVEDVLGLQFLGANPNAQAVGTDLLSSRSNYFPSNDPSTWHTDVPNYGGVTYHDIYPGIDLVFNDSGQHQLEFNFVVSPGADPNTIHLSYQGVQSMSVDGQGDLLLNTAHGQVVQKTPGLFQQQADGQHTPVTGQYQLLGNGFVGLQLGSYDPTQPLTIDPVLSYSTYLGGSAGDTGTGIAVDANGSAYVTGFTASTNFPTTSGAFQGTLSGTNDAFVTKFNPAGNALMYSTYLGNGVSPTEGVAVAVDVAGNAYVTGQTSSSSFPTTAGAYQSALHGSSDAFVSKLDAAGNALVYSTYLGGSGSGMGQQQGTGIAVNGQGQAVVTGFTNASNFPTTTGAPQGSLSGTQDAFVTQLNAAGSGLLYSTYLGGSGTDTGTGVALDPAGDAYVTGSTTSSNFPTTSGAYQTADPGAGTNAFLTKVNATGTAWVYSSYLGGSSGSAQGNAVAVNAAGDAYITGATTTSTFPTTGGAYQTSLPMFLNDAAFVTEVAASGGSLVYSSFLSGSGMLGNTQGLGIAVDGQGQAHVTGLTNDSTFPTLNATQSSYGGNTDAFVTRLNAAGSGLVFSTFLGGSGADQGNGIAVDLAGNSYVVGTTSSTNFPTANAFQSSSGGTGDAFVTKITASVSTPVITGLNSGTSLSANSWVTSSQNLTLSGTATPSSTVTLYRRDVGVIGTATANGSGAWSYNYSGTTLPEGTYAFAATATLGGVTSPQSAPEFLAIVDLTAPAVTLTAPATTTDTSPSVTVTASDLNGLPNGTTVHIDVDLNNDGNFTDTGESNYASGTLTNGTATIKLPNLTAGTTVQVRGRLNDQAGNQGTSNVVSMTIQTATSWSASTQALSLDPHAGMAQEQLGDLQVSHALQLDQSGGSAGGNVDFVYDSARVSPEPIVQGTIQSPNNASLPSTITATLTWNPGPSQSVVTATYSTTGFSPGESFTVALQVPGAVTTTGRYGWSLQMTEGSNTQTVTGFTYVVVDNTDPFGAGWELSDVDRLVSIPADSYGPAGVLRVYGTGGYRFYAGTSGTLTSPTGDNGTMVESSGGGVTTFTYTQPDGTETVFNGSGQETEIVSPDGLAITTFSYSSGLLSTQQNPDGSTATFTYSSSLLSTITEPGTRTVTFAQSSGNLTQITNPDGGTHTFTYDSAHHLTGDTFGTLVNSYAYTNSALSSYTWGSGTGSTSQVSPAVVQGLSALVDGPALATDTNPLGNATQYQLDSAGRVLSEQMPDGGVYQYTRNSNSWVTAETDPLGRVTTYTVDTQGYDTQITYPDGSSESNVYQTAFHALTQHTDANGNIYTYTYDSGGHQLTAKDPLGNVTTNTYLTSGLLQTVTDPLGHVSTYAYDSQRRLSTVTNALGGVESYTYDSNGNLATTTDALGRVTTTVNDAMGRVTQQTNPAGGVSSMVYNGAGLLLQSYDELGRKTLNQYDSRGLLTSATSADGTGVQQSTLYTYDAAGQQIAVRDANGFWTTTTYDAVGRVTGTLNPDGTSTGNVYDLAGQLTASKDQLGRVSKQVYNSRGWVTQSIDALGDTTTTAYDHNGNPTSVTDPLGNVTQTQYDALNRATTVTEAYGTSIARTTVTAYDAVGNVTSRTDPLGNVTKYQYDALNRTTTVIAAYGTSIAQTTTTAYDAAGNVTSSTDPAGEVTSFTYDSLNRQTGETAGVGTSSPQTGTTVYDAMGNVLNTIDALEQKVTNVYDALNQMTQSTDARNETTTSIYNADGQVAATVTPAGQAQQTATNPVGQGSVQINAQGALTQTTHDGAGNVVATKDALGNVAQTVYDNLNRPIQSTDALGNVTTTVYDADGNVIKTIDALGKVTTYSYDALNRRVSVQEPTGGITTTVYDADNNVVNTIDANGDKATFVYDALNRRTQSIDPLGNITTTGYDSRNNVVKEIDPAGNVTTFVYNTLNQKVGEQDPDGNVITYTYDSDNRLTSQVDALNREETFSCIASVGTGICLRGS